MSEADNVRSFAPDRLGVYEVWYSTWNDPKTGQGFWLRYLIEAPLAGHGVPVFGDAPRGELWFARFDPYDSARTFGIHRRYAEFSSSDSPFAVTIGGATHTNASAVGQLAGNGHTVQWNLRWEPASTTLRFIPDAMYARGGLSSSMVHAPNAAVPMSGIVTVDGEAYTLDRVLFTQSHVWARKHTLAWTWAHCHEFEDAPGAMLELLSGKMERGAVVLPNMAGIVLVLDGETHRLNQLRHILGNRATFRPGKVWFRTGNASLRVEGTFTCTPDKMLNCPYWDPDGQGLWCANTEIADATVTVSRRSGLRWREHRRLVSRGRAHYEVGGRASDPAVTTPHVLVA
ncbi:hypothetical protein BH11MYX2_BH11MYX2_27820 [soil metagenome]